MTIKKLEDSRFAIVDDNGEIFKDFIYDDEEDAKTALLLLKASEAK